MDNQQSHMTPRAQSIVALGFSRDTRRFLLRIGVKTADSLLGLDRNYLACNGAGDSVLEEVQSYLDGVESVRPNYSELALGSEVAEEAERDVLLVGESLSSGSDVSPDEYCRLVQCGEQAVCGLPDEQAGSRAKKAIEPIELRHIPLDEFLYDLATDEDGLEDNDEAMGNAVGELMLPSNRTIAIHSPNKRLLESLAHAAALRYEAIVAEQSEPEFYFDWPLTELPLGARAANILERHRISTVGELCSFGESALRGARGAGDKVVSDIKNALRGLSENLVPVFVDVGEGPHGSSLCPSGQSESGGPTRYAKYNLSLRSVPLDTSSLSVRARHSLMQGAVSTVGEVLELGEEGLLRLRNTGEKTAAEILLQAKEQADAYTCSHDEDDTVSCELVAAKNNETVEQGPGNGPLSIRSVLTDVSSTALLSPFQVADLVKTCNAEVIQSLVEDSMFCDLLRRNPWGMTQDEILASANLLDNSLTVKSLMVIAGRADSSKRAYCNEGLWHLTQLSIEDVLNKRIDIDERRSMVRSRLSGRTLESIAEDFGITRERVRQITSKAMDKDLLSGTRAGRYLDLMRRYELNEREVRFGLGATAEEWEAASFVKKTQCQDDPPPVSAEMLTEDRRIPLRVRLSLESEIHHGQVKIEGEYIPEQRLDLMLFALKRYGSKSSLSDNELATHYRQMLVSLGIQDNPKLQLSDRYMSNFRLQKCVLSGYWNRVRYYDFDKHDLRELIDSLGFEDYEDKEISTRLFLRTRPELLREFEIDDPYELHSLLRSYSREAEKTGEALPYSMTRRMPIIRIGKTDRATQVIEFAQELSPITVDDFAAAYEEEYGVEQASVKGDYLKYLSSYTANGVISMNLAPFTEEENKRMAELFPGDYYKLSSFEAGYRREFPDAGTDRLNSLSIHNLGFKIYSSCLLRDAWGSQNAYFDSLVLGGEFYDESSVDPVVATSRLFGVYIDGLVRARRLLPYDGSSYITEAGLCELGITDALMLEFADAAATHCAEHGRSYCTTRSLKNEGFAHELFAYDLDDAFYVALLCTQGTRFAALNCCRKRIACLDGAKASIAAFIEAQMEEGESLTIDDLIARTEADYGITIRRDKAVSAPERSDLYYSPITDMIYWNRQTFIKEIE